MEKTLWAIIFVSRVFATDISSTFRLSSLKNEEREIAMELAMEVDELLPENLKSKIAQKITVTFKSLNDGEIPLPSCHASSVGVKKRPVVYGRFNHLTKNIFIEKQLLSWFSQKNFFNCHHKDSRQTVRAVVIHEMFHAYDTAKFQRQWEGDGKCLYKVRPKSSKSRTTDSRRCEKLRKQFSRRYRVTSDVLFQDQSFWARHRHNTRIPSRYETQNSIEYGAVNFEYFILDKEYKCRRPLQYRYFAREFNHTPFPDYECPSLDKVYVTPATSGQNSLIAIDPSRVYQIQYLLAEKGDKGASSFGHSMIRLVICASRTSQYIWRTRFPNPLRPRLLK